MSKYPEHDKLSDVQAQTLAAGEFVEWLATQGVQLMMWREDLTDERPADPECHHRNDGGISLRACDQTRNEGDGELPAAYWRRHCKHWQHLERAASGEEQRGVCCRCGLGRFCEVTGIHAWTGPGRDLQALLADWAGIDQGKLEAEKRAMIAEARAANIDA